MGGSDGGNLGVADGFATSRVGFGSGRRRTRCNVERPETFSEVSDDPPIKECMRGESATQANRRREAWGCWLMAAALVAGCGESPTGLDGGLPDGSYVITTGDPRIVDEFVTPGWMREMPTIEFTKQGSSFMVTGSSDDLVVLGAVQLAEEENGFWRVWFGWAPDEVHHYWEILMTAGECAAAAVDADLGIPPTGSLTVVLEECSIASS